MSPRRDAHHNLDSPFLSAEDVDAGTVVTDRRDEHADVDAENGDNGPSGAEWAADGENVAAEHRADVENAEAEQAADADDAEDAVVAEDAEYRPDGENPDAENNDGENPDAEGTDPAALAADADLAHDAEHPGTGELPADPDLVRDAEFAGDAELARDDVYRADATGDATLVDGDPDATLVDRNPDTAVVDENADDEAVLAENADADAEDREATLVDEDADDEAVLVDQDAAVDDAEDGDDVDTDEDAALATDVSDTETAEDRDEPVIPVVDEADGTVVGAAVVDGVVVEGRGDQTAADLAATDTCAEPEPDIAPADLPVGADGTSDLVAAGAVAGATAGTMRPGEAAPVGVVAPHAAVPDADLAARWQEIQVGFIDDPRAAADAARGLVEEAIEARIEALRAQQRSLDEWQTHDGPDTEVLRAAVRGYRDLHAGLQ